MHCSLEECFSRLTLLSAMKLSCQLKRHILLLSHSLI